MAAFMFCDHYSAMQHDYGFRKMPGCLYIVFVLSLGWLIPLGRGSVREKVKVQGKTVMAWEVPCA